MPAARSACASSRATSSWSRARARSGGRPVLRVGILGGAFNPPHLGHLICAQEAHERLGLDSVVLVPVGEAPHRELAEDPGGEVRARLCERAVADDPRLSVSRVEVDRAGPSYTLDTLRLLRELAPGDELTLILGADQAAALPSWHDPEEVLGLVRIGVASREGLEREAVLRRLGALPAGGRLDFFDMPRIDVSSSLVRERVARRRPIRYLVPDAVASVIASRGLYAAPSGRPTRDEASYGEQRADEAATPNSAWAG